MAIILVVVLVISGAIGGLMFLQQWKRQRQDAFLRASGIAAYEQGDEAAAVDDLRTYLNHQRDDVEALYIYAQASLKNPQPGNRHIGQAIGALNQVVKLDPDHKDAAYDLLMLQTLVGQNEDAIKIADTLLEKDPRDTKALASKAVALMRLHQREEALAVAEAALAIDPSLYQVNLVRIQLRHEMGEPVEDLLESAKALQQANPEDPRYEMLLGYTYALADNSEQAAHWLLSAAKRDLPDEQFAITLLNVLDTAQMYPQSLDLLMRVDQNTGWSKLRTELARRLFEGGRFQDLVDQFGELDVESAEVEVIALKAMALYQLDRRGEADKLRAALAQRTTSAQAPVWASVLRAVFKPEPQALEIIETCETALEVVPGNGYFHGFQGNAYASLGDDELAMASWRKAAEARQSWGGIRSRIAQALLNKKHAEEAVRFAREAYVREPRDIDNVVTWVQARVMEIDDFTGSDARQMLDLIDEVQKAAPGEPRTRVLRVSVLARMGRPDEAAAALLAILDDDRELTQAYWLLLAEVSRTHGLGLEDRVLARIQEQEGNTAELALTRATQLARAGKPDEGLAVIKAGLDAATGPQRARWQLVWAMFLDILNDQRAHDAWAQLADEHPDYIRGLELALRARSVQSDRRLSGRIVDRLGELMGEGSVTWRTLKARHLIDSPEVARDSAAAIALLRKVIEDTPRRVEPRLMLAQALEQLDRQTQAIAELRAADQAIPNTPRIHLELARLHQEVRQYPGARNYLDQVLNNPQATVDEQRQAANLLIQQGEDARAMGVLERLQADPDTASDQQQLLLATLYHRGGQSDRAQAILEEALARQPDAETLAFALEFYQSRNRPQQVRRVLTMLEASAPEDQRQQILASFYARTGDVGQAAALYQARVEDSPTDALAWRQLVAIHLAAGEVDQALQAIEQGLTHVPDDAALTRARDRAEAIRQTVRIDWARPLLIALVGDDRQGEAAAQALRLIARAVAAANAEATINLASQLRSLADQHPDVLSLQTVSARVHLAAHQPREAAAVASRAARTFPRATEPTWLHAQALAEAGQWLDAMGAATEWRRRSHGSTQAPDTLIAEAHLQLNDPDRALRTLEPHVAAALAAPADHAGVVSRYVRALVALKRYDQANQTLAPLLPRDAAWRGLAMQLAAEKIADSAIAADWLGQVGEAVAETAIPERMELTKSYWRLSQRLGDAPLAAEARQMIDRITADPAAPAGAWYMRGVMAENADDLAAAEASYRAAMERDGEAPEIRNNLAMVLVRRESSSDAISEARRLAQSAVDAAPGNVFFLDTLAAVQARAGEVDAAIATLNRAIELDPTNDLWKQNLANILKDAGRDEEAQKVLDQIQRQAGA